MEFFKLTSLLSWISAHPHWSYAAVFFVALTESLAIVGLFMPGAVLMLGIGALIAAGALDVWVTLSLAVAGALAGDVISYWLGHHYHERLRAMWPFSRYPQLVARGEAFFHRHGGKSVLLGRFVGPLRPVMPAIAGMLGMRPARFLLVSSISALGWAPAYILPGVVLGASLGLASAVATRLAVLVVLLALLIWFSIWGTRRIVSLLQPRAEAIVTRLVAWGRSHPLLGQITAALVDPYHPEPRGLLMGAGILLLAAWIFLVMGESGKPLGASSAVFHILQGLRTPWADQAMVLLAQLGDTQVIAPLVGILLLALLWQRHWQAALHWLAAAAFAVLLALLFQHNSSIPRPSLQNDPSVYLFPAAHVTLSIVIYGFLAVLVARELTMKWRWVPYAVVSALIMAVCLAHLYLGAVWLSDVLAALALGLAWVALLGIAYRRHFSAVLPPRLLIITIVITLAAAASWHVSQHHTQDVQRYALTYPIQALDAQAWWEHDWQGLPAHRVDIKGEPKQPLTVQWAGALDDLRKHLEAQGWRVPVQPGFASALQWLAPQPKLAQLPVLPQVHDGRHESLLLVYQLPATGGQVDKQWVLRLWPADAVLSGSGAGVWVGNVTRQHLSHPLRALTITRTEAEVNMPIDELRAMLDGLSWQLVQRKVAADAAVHGWNGKLLLIRPLHLAPANF